MQIMKPQPAGTAWIRDLIQTFIATSVQNTLGNASAEKAFDAPLVGFCPADDPLFLEYKSVIGEFHRTPLEVFGIAFPDAEVRATDLAVICWILPQTEKTRRDNGAQDFYPAESWARARMFGERTNEELRRHVVNSLMAHGIAAVAPVLMPEYSSTEDTPVGWASTWSERHVAHAAGLGTFGLCDGLITSLGKAMRVGSVVARIQAPSVSRPYGNRNAYCLHLSGRGCGACIRRCPVGAITSEGHDKNLCRAHLNGTCSIFIKENYGFEGHGCGLCQTGVPCESGVPLP